MPPIGIIAHNSRRHKCYTATTYFNPRISRLHVSSLYFAHFKIFLDFLRFYIDLLRRTAYNNKCQEELIQMAINKPEETKNEVR